MGKNNEWIQAREQEKERLTKALEVSPNDPAALADLGTFFTRREENFGQAEELFQQAMDIAPENTRILAQYAEFWAWRFRRAPWT
ncbi:MAG TPA: hypothetical protein VKK79_10215, partial [Candidatus Lokiarchaeia archaeon]|nr:hypothetical protein [Candidatus Lokiarchaeia archaeon]